ncbi:hypothetical protein MTO96_024779 [Rhipicephalus appendiculatus]
MFVPCAGSLDTTRTCAPRQCRRPTGVRSAAELDWTSRNHTSAIQAVRSVAGRTLPALETARADIANQPPPSPQASRLGKHATAAGHGLVTVRERNKASTRSATTATLNLIPVPIQEIGGVPIQGTPVSPEEQRGGSDVNSAVPGPQVNGSSDCELSLASSRTRETHIGSIQRSSLTSQKQASIAGIVDNALEEKFSAFTALINQMIEQSVFSHVSALEARNAQQFHELTAPYITQMESLIAKYNRQVSQLNEGKHTKDVKQLSGRRDMPATSLHINLDSDGDSTMPRDG